MTEQWRQQLQRKLADYEQPAPDVAWDKLDEALTAASTHGRLVPIWLRRVAAAAVILLVAGVGYWILLSSEPSPAGDGARLAGLKEGRRHSQPASSAIPSVPTIPSAPAVHSATASRALAMRLPKAIVPVADAGVAASDTVAETSTTNASDEDTITTRHPSPNTHHPSSITHHPSPNTQRPTPITQHPSPFPQRLTAKVYYSNMIGGSGNRLLVVNGREPQSSVDYTQSDPPLQPGNNAPQSDPQIPGTPSGGNPQSEGATSAVDTTATATSRRAFTRNADDGDLQQVNYHAPLRLGLSLRYRLDSRWSLEAGLTYTRLTADITPVGLGQTAGATSHEPSNVKSVATTEHQHFIGLPLAVSYMLWSSRRLSLYGVGGLTVEKELQAAPWQLSAGAAVGIDCRLYSHLSLFAEPGLTYYFDNGSSHHYIYDDRRLTFSLTLGLRFSFE